MYTIHWAILSSKTCPCSVLGYHVKIYHRENWNLFNFACFLIPEDCADRVSHSYGPTPEQRHDFCFALVWDLNWRGQTWQQAGVHSVPPVTRCETSCQLFHLSESTNVEWLTPTTAQSQTKFKHKANSAKLTKYVGRSGFKWLRWYESVMIPESILL